MIPYFLSQSLLTLFIYTLFLSNSRIPGGIAGMTPFLVAILVLTQFLIGFFLLFLFRKKLNVFKNKFISLFLYLILYELTALLLSEEFLIANIFKSGYEGQLNKMYSFSSLFSGLIVFLIFLIIEKKNVQI